MRQNVRLNENFPNEHIIRELYGLNIIGFHQKSLYAIGKRIDEIRNVAPNVGTMVTRKK